MNTCCIRRMWQINFDLIWPSDLCSQAMIHWYDARPPSRTRLSTIHILNHWRSRACGVAGVSEAKREDLLRKNLPMWDSPIFVWSSRSVLHYMRLSWSTYWYKLMHVAFWTLKNTCLHAYLPSHWLEGRYACSRIHSIIEDMYFHC
jgi:hypothetical protein